MPNSFMFIISVIILFAGCAILFLDVIISLSTDRCKIPVPGKYIAKSDSNGENSEANRSSGFCVLAIPEFSYEFEGKRYQGRSANMFFHLYLRPGKLAVPFIDGKTYEVFVNPVKPNVFVTAGEQRLPFYRLLGIVIVVVGMLMLYSSMQF